MWNMINVGIVDDHPVVRAGLREFLDGFVDLRVVGEAANGLEAIELVHRVDLDLDVLLLDLMMPAYSGQDALARIKRKALDVAVLVLSGYPDEVYATTMIRQGASGYLNKDCAPEVVVQAIRTVARGRLYMTSVLTESLPLPLERDTSKRCMRVFLHASCRCC